jgi:hypothetical protein
VFNADIEEEASAEDTNIVAGSVFNADIEEQAQGQDESDAPGSIYSAQITEASTGVDQNTVSASTFNAVISESSVGVDSTAAAVDFIVQIQESVQAADLFVSRLLWETIDTSATTIWTNIESADLTFNVTPSAAFSQGAFASGPIAGIGGDLTVVISGTKWENLNTAQTTTWDVVPTL